MDPAFLASATLDGEGEPEIVRLGDRQLTVADLDTRLLYIKVRGCINQIAPDKLGSWLLTGAILNMPSPLNRTYRVGPILGQGANGIVYGPDPAAPSAERMTMKLVQLPHEARTLLAIQAHFPAWTLGDTAIPKLLHHTANTRLIATTHLDPNVRDMFARSPFLQKNVLSIFSEALPDGAVSLHNFMLQQGHWPANYPAHGFCQQVLMDLLQGIQTLHTAKYVHYDIKPDNIIIYQQGNKVRAALIDFGIAHLYEDAQGAHIPQSILNIGTSPCFTAWEHMAQHGYSRRADLQQLCYIAFMLITGNYAWWMNSLNVGINKFILKLVTPNFSAQDTFGPGIGAPPNNKPVSLRLLKKWIAICRGEESFPQWHAPPYYLGSKCTQINHNYTRAGDPAKEESLSALNDLWHDCWSMSYQQAPDYERIRTIIQRITL